MESINTTFKCSLRACNIWRRRWVLLLLVLVQTACKKLIEVAPPESTIGVTDVFTTDVSAAAVLTGIYTNMSNSNSTEFYKGGFTSMSLFPSLSADELTSVAPGSLTYNAYYTNELTSSIDPYQSPDYWKIIYPIIFVTNSAIEGLENAPHLTPIVKQQLMGEAKFMRAFCYFYLVNLYGAVPLAISTDWQVNAVLSRSPVAKVYQQIISDLKDAQSLLSEIYLQADVMSKTSERVRPTKWAATALLARAYLYTEDWANTEIQATAVINNSTLFDLPAPDYAFRRFSRETIWQLRGVGAKPDVYNSATTLNTGEGLLFILPSWGPSPYGNPVYLSNNIASNFEADDQRKMSWVNSVTVGSNTYYYPFKYKIGVTDLPYSLENSIVMRLGEQYLIRAEARAQQNNIGGAQNDVNAIRTRAGLSNTTADNKTTLLTAILQERKVELFTEWGHRWLDLKRTGNIDAVMSLVAHQKGASWKTTDQLYPIPLTELKKAPQLAQNAGYY